MLEPARVPFSRFSAYQARGWTFALTVALATSCERSSASPSPAIVALSASSASFSASSASPTATGPQLEPAPAAPATKVSEPRLFVKSRFVFVRPVPDAGKDWIGFLWTGGVVALKSSAPRRGPGCKAFYAIEPRGYVCADGENATLDEQDLVYRALLPYAPKVDSPWLHRYAESLGLVRYHSAPTAELQRQREPELSAHSKKLAHARAADGAAQADGVDLALPEQAGFEFPKLPRAVFDSRKAISQYSTVAYSTEARFGERGFLLTADYTWVPKDRVKPYPVVKFRGVRLGVDARLPLAFIRKEGRARYARSEGGAFEAQGEVFTRLSYVELTGNAQYWRGQRYFETREPSVWIREMDAAIPAPRAKTPWGATLGGDDTTGRTPKGRATWIEVSIDDGWLVAVEGTRPVYATLVSPGLGGVAGPDQNPLEVSASPTGTYPISGKLVTANMVAPGELIHSDVPFVQNIVKPYALHGAYWHENWGNPQSGGCINLSPTDAKWLFEFSEPEVPKGWHAVRWVPNQGPATVVVLHR